ncbi:MAG: HAMP domain-containing protein [Saprospirales bacterium]|nr:MAG: HAMP domain-containing protein [Saprospirales bacterium]
MFLGLFAVLLVLSSATFIFYQTDRTDEFIKAWDEYIEIAISEQVESSFGAGFKLFPSLNSYYHPQVVIKHNDHISSFSNPWISFFPDRKSNGEISLGSRDGVHYYLKDRLHIKNSDSLYSQLVVPILFEEPKEQAIFYSMFFNRFIQTDYAFDILNGELQISPAGKVRSFLFQYILAYGWLMFVLVVIIFVVVNIFRHRELIHNNPLQILGLFTIVLLIRLLWNVPLVVEVMEAIPLFVRETYFLFMSGSLGKLTMDVLLFCGFSLFLLNFPIAKLFANRNPGLKALFAVGLYFSVILLFTFFGKSVSQLVYYSNIQLDLEEVFNLDVYSFILLTVIMLYLFSVFVLGLKAGELIFKMEIPLANRFMAAGAAALLSFPIFLSVEVPLPPFPFYLGVFIFIFLLDIFSEKKKPSYPWMVLWLLILSGFGASMLFSFSLDKDIQQRAELSQVFKGDNGAKQLDFKSVYEKVKKLRMVGERKYDYTLYEDGKKLFSSNSLYPEILPESWDIQTEGSLLRKNRRSEWVKSWHVNNSNMQLVIGKYSADYLKPFSLFSYLFFLSAILGVLLLYANSVVPVFPKAWDVRRPRARSLRRKIQFIIISLTLASLILVSLITIIFFNVNSQRELKENLFADLQRAKTVIKDYYDEKNNLSLILPDEIERQLELRVGILNFSDHRTEEELSHLQHTGFPVFLDASVREKITNIGPILNKEINRHFPNNTGIIDLLRLGSEKDHALFLIPDDVFRHGSVGFTDFLSTLINVYLFLFLLSGVLAFIFAEGITQPLLRLRDNLNKIRLGKDNEPLEWENDDEIGELIADYNRIISEINEGVKFMAMTEREDAWREMAKQIAHEIKNPLTPMKLSIQHLQFASKRGNTDLNPLIERTTATLIEQIDNLSQIASEFSSFAKMPEARNEKVNLNEMVRSAHDLFRNREDMDVDLMLPIDDVFVFADKNYLIRVLTNLMKNSLQAIPIDRRGKIWIRLYRRRDVAIIEVQDNGSGIPEEMKEKVFKPNFTSKSSGTGLGLAISQNIVEAFHGRIYFETEKDKGTRFFVEIPLMRMKGNMDEITRVNL